MDTLTEPQNLEQTVAAFVKRTRRDYGLTLQDVAEAGTRHGARWYKSSVLNIEQATSALTLSVLVPLCRALSDLTGEEICVLDLLGNEEKVVLHRNSSTVVDPGELKEALVGRQAPRRATRARRSSPSEIRAARMLGVSISALHERALDTFGMRLQSHLDRLSGDTASPCRYAKYFERALRDLQDQPRAPKSATRLVLAQ